MSSSNSTSSSPFEEMEGKADERGIADGQSSSNSRSPSNNPPSSGTRSPSNNPSSSRRRSMSDDPASSRPRLQSDHPSFFQRQVKDDVLLPELLISIAIQLAINVNRRDGRIAVAPAIVSFFQVCSAWESISRSEFLWENLTNCVWSAYSRRLPTWRGEFVRLHRTACNFRTNRSTQHILFGRTEALSCCLRLALSDGYIAAGFVEGTVCVFSIPEGVHFATHGPLPNRELHFAFSQSISGIILGPHQIVFASMDGDIHVVPLIRDSTDRYRAMVGNVLENGTLVDFAGVAALWVGLYDGFSRKSWRVWNGLGQLVYEGGRFTEEDLMAVHPMEPPVGRVRMVEFGLVVGVNQSGIEIIRVDEQTLTNHEGIWDGDIFLVDAADAVGGRIMLVDQTGTGRLVEARTLVELCQFSVVRRDEVFRFPRYTVGCMNRGYLVMCNDGFNRGIRVWDGQSGNFLYEFRERIQNVSAAAASERYVAVWSCLTGLNLWDFGGF